MAKNIVIFSDGTGQEGGEGPDTNIYRFFKIIEDRTSRQISFYSKGIGSEKAELISKGTGLGITKNLLECYKFIYENFEAGDKIFLFGFSRGAATVRSLSGFIHLFGILPKSRPGLIDEAYDIYKIKNRKKREQKAASFISKHYTMWTQIEFIGAFDTVAALGLPSGFFNRILNSLPFLKNNFHDFTLSQSVVHARHALSIDDERKAFHPVLWDPAIHANQTLEQVWFLGAHTDVGGGYEEHGLADISYLWMLNEAKAKGLITFDETKISLAPNPNAKMHEEKYIIKNIKKYPKKTRSWPHGKPVIHSSVLERTTGRHNDNKPYKPWILNSEYTIANSTRLSDIA